MPTLTPFTVVKFKELKNGSILGTSPNADYHVAKNFVEIIKQLIREIIISTKINKEEELTEFFIVLAGFLQRFTEQMQGKAVQEAYRLCLESEKIWSNKVISSLLPLDHIEIIEGEKTETVPLKIEVLNQVEILLGNQESSKDIKVLRGRTDKTLQITVGAKIILLRIIPWSSLIFKSDLIQSIKEKIVQAKIDSENPIKIDEWDEDFLIMHRFLEYLRVQSRPIKIKSDLPGNLFNSFLETKITKENKFYDIAKGDDFSREYVLEEMAMMLTWHNVLYPYSKSDVAKKIFEAIKAIQDYVELNKSTIEESFKSYYKTKFKKTVTFNSEAVKSILALEIEDYRVDFKIEGARKEKNKNQQKKYYSKDGSHITNSKMDVSPIGSPEHRSATKFPFWQQEDALSGTVQNSSFNLSNNSVTTLPNNGSNNSIETTSLVTQEKNLELIRISIKALMLGWMNSSRPIGELQREAEVCIEAVIQSSDISKGMDKIIVSEVLSNQTTPQGSPDGNDESPLNGNRQFNM